MKNFGLILVLIWSVVWIVSTTPRKNDAVQKFHKTGEAIAAQYLISKYEKEHQQLYNEEVNDGTLLWWSGLDNKNLSDFCRTYLQHSVPTRTTNKAIGAKIVRKLGYEAGNSSMISRIFVVRCTVMYRTHRMTFYMTRAPEPNCAYALKSTGNRMELIFKIIHKHCDFENKPLINKSKKRKWPENVGKVHQRTGQYVANDEYLLKYELDHQKLLKQEGKEGKSIEWIYAMVHSDLNSYCYQYMSECAPNRRREGVIGTWQNDRLHYQKLKTVENVEVVVVKCKPHNAIKRNFYMTRTLEMNCVYALLRRGLHRFTPLVIIFKYCDFEHANVKQNIIENVGNVDENVIAESKVKEENFNTIETVQFFLSD